MKKVLLLAVALIVFASCEKAEVLVKEEVKKTDSVPAPNIKDQEGEGGGGFNDF